MKRKIVTLMLVAMMVINVTACGGSNSESSKKTETASKEKEYVDDITAVASNPDSYNGKYIKFTGIVSTVDSNDDIYGCQVYVDMDYNNSVLVEIPKSIMPETPKTDDLINFDAKIEKAKDGQTVMGVDSTWAYLVADSAEKTTYLESFGKLMQHGNLQIRSLNKTEFLSLLQKLNLQKMRQDFMSLLQTTQLIR